MHVYLSFAWNFVNCVFHLIILLKIPLFVIKKFPSEQAPLRRVLSDHSFASWCTYGVCIMRLLSMCGCGFFSVVNDFLMCPNSLVY